MNNEKASISTRHQQRKKKNSLRKRREWIGETGIWGAAGVTAKKKELREETEKSKMVWEFEG